MYKKLLTLSAVCFVLGSVAAPVQAERIAGDDFENYPIGRVYGDWTSATQVIVTNAPGQAHGGENYVRIGRNPDGISTTLYASSRIVGKEYVLPSSGEVRLDVWTYVAVTADSINELLAGQIRIGTSGNIATVSHSSDGMIKVSLGGPVINTGIKWNDAGLINQWNRHTLIFDIEAGQADYLFNGVELISNQPVSTFADFGKFDIRAQFNQTNPNAEFRVDDIEWSASSPGLRLYILSGGEGRAFPVGRYALQSVRKI